MKSLMKSALCSTVLLGACVLFAAPGKDGLAVNFPLNEGSGSEVIDAANQMPKKIINPQFTKWGAGPAGPVLEFCNKHQAMDRGCINIGWPAFDLAKPFTMTMKIKTAPDLMRKRSYQLAIIGGREDGCFALELAWDMFYVAFKKDGKAESIVTKPTELKISADTWYSLVWVYDGKVIRTYVDGMERASGEAVFKTPKSPYILLGASSVNGAGYGFEGLMADFRIYNRAWTADEIAAEALKDE